ncbi:Fe2+-dependent dioxygenase [Novosphingobium sediminicola]|uniref:PKHD-type hydroxylase n=1 Tax=Novosphingobium sediminicola TaxID=563162 RepID=A0A7W6G583_9SPHN|nr:Fe2+-dependent dioxygenase [Novosphingobium sediminicola]MBB3953800.1 PKHD-type hydroxylase [Novosphingobium sediminicola]
MTAYPLTIPAVLDAAELAQLRAILLAGPWEDGLATAGPLSAPVKRNRQLPEQCPAAREAGAIISAALGRHALFMSAALPARIAPPMFNRYRAGEAYGAHIDGALRQSQGLRIRTDLSATLFLTPPQDYEGGALSITMGAMPLDIKGKAGDMILYPSSTIHAVGPVTSGERLSCFFWVQSILRDPIQRQTLFELDRAIQGLAACPVPSETLLGFNQTYHNLVRMWADG